MESLMTNFAIPLTYVLIAVAALGAIVFPILTALRDDPKSLVKPVGAILVLAVLFGISWAISGNEVTTIYKEFNVEEVGSKRIGGAIIMTYVLIIGAFFAAIVDKVMGFLK